MLCKHNTMNFLIRNQAGVPNKYIRFAKWKIRKLKSKFQHLLYAEIFIQKEGGSPVIYAAKVRLGVEGHDIILSEKSKNLNELWSDLSAKVKRHLGRHSEKLNSTARRTKPA